MYHEFRNILIERLEKNLLFEIKTEVFINHDMMHHIGFAMIKEIDGEYFADFFLSVFGSEKPMKLYPSVGIHDGIIKQIGLCSSPNIDEEINPIEIK